MKRSKQIFLFIILPIIVIVGIFYILSGNNKTNGEDVSVDWMEDEFIEVIGDNVFLNLGITVESRGVYYGADGSVMYIVSNNTDEPITFQDRSYGLIIFYPDYQFKEWEILNTIYGSEPTLVTIPPMTQKFTEGNLNFYVIQFRYIENLDSEMIRLYVTGVGSDTGKIYGAYIDIEPRIP